jgi:hypothetical protein
MVQHFEQVDVPTRNNNASFKTVCYYPMSVPLNLTVNATLPYDLLESSHCKKEMVEDYEVVTYTNVICYSDSKQGIYTYFIMLTALMFFA